MGDFGMDYGGGGGGTSVGGGGGYSSQQGSGQIARPRKAYDEQTLIPVTVRMVLDSCADGAGGSVTLADGRPLHQVKLVAAIRSVTENSTFILYEIEDGTGLTEIKDWINESNDCAAVAEMRRQLKDGAYVRVIGQVKEYEGKKSVLAHSIRTLSTGNELTHHMLEVVYSAMRTKNQNSIVTSAAPMAGNNMGTMGGVGNRGAVYEMGGAGSGNALNDTVLDFIKREGSHLDVGVDVEKIIKALAGQYNEGQIRNAIDTIAGEGHIYSTINENWYKHAS